jgi:hypothetical protein
MSDPNNGNIAQLIMDNYLKQQVQQTCIDDADETPQPKLEMPDPNELLDFKNHVREWLNHDSQHRVVRKQCSDMMTAKKALTAKILEFMGRYNIEDLNTQGGKLRLKMVQVKEPLSQADIKNKVLEHFGKTQDPNELNSIIFSQRNVVNKPTLRRIAPPKAT